MNNPIGKAFRGCDGIIRWVTGISTRNNYAVLWLDETANVWYQGGTVKAALWQGGEEVQAPQPGETYLLAGALGGHRTMTA